MGSLVLDPAFGRSAGKSDFGFESLDKCFLRFLKISRTSLGRTIFTPIEGILGKEKGKSVVA